ncbi:hypothetical protein GQ457_01G038170 [Hibiscus cannabinus]
MMEALASSSQRRNLLEELFADVALEIDDRAKEKSQYLPQGTVLMVGVMIQEGKLGFAGEELGMKSEKGENCSKLEQLEKGIASDRDSSCKGVYGVQLFEVQLDDADVQLRYASALVQGATNVFWQEFKIDIQSNTRRFRSLFRYLIDEVALEPTRLNKIPIQAQRDLYLLMSKVIFFYNSVEKLESLLKFCPTFPNALLTGGPADILVLELADQLQKLKVEPVLLHYLGQIKVVRGMELRIATSTRLKTCLYSFTSPGGPTYPTRVVRHAAWDALDLLFPVAVGRYPRHLISLSFRLLYPWYWPSL